jgi:hypothetical protein
MGMRKGIDRENVAPFFDIQAEFAVEIPRDGQMRNCKVKTIERMNPKFSRSAARIDKSLDRRHRISSRQNSIGRRFAPRSN